MKYLAVFGCTLVATCFAVVELPVLKWQRGGCYQSWCETGWYSSPYVGPLDPASTAPAIISSAYSVVRLNPADGSLIWRAMSGHAVSEGTSASNNGRTWPGIIVADIDGDSNLEIATGHGAGAVSVYTAAGEFKSGWPRSPFSEEVRSLCAADIDSNGQMELIVGRAAGDHTNNIVLQWDGSTRSGWPKPSSDTADGYSWGIFNSNIAVGDLFKDGKLQIVVPSDVHYICAYFENATSIKSPALYSNKPWGQVGAYTNFADEHRGYGDCSAGAGTTRANFAAGVASIIDVDGDNVTEVVVTGNVHDCSTSPYTDKYIGVFIFKADRTRWSNSKYNWTTVPINTGGILVYDYDVIESVQWNVVVADLDGDGEKEILFSSFDGKLHAFWLDKTEHGSWPFVAGDSSHIRMVSEPIVVDLDNDGAAEVICTTWTAKTSSLPGSLYILSSTGTILQQVQLPIQTGSQWDGVLSAPTIANIDSDPDFELVLQSAHSGVLAYDLPNTASAKIYWQTGRGNFQRTGSGQNPPFRPRPGTRGSAAGAVIGILFAVLIIGAAAGATVFVVFRIKAGKRPIPSKEEWKAYGKKAMFWGKTAGTAGTTA